MFKLISILIAVSFTNTALCQLPVKPQTPTPEPLIREAFMPKNEVLLSFPMEAVYDGKPIWLWKYHHRTLDDLVVSNISGKKLTKEEIRKALRKPTMVLVSRDGQPVHPYYLRVMKPDTLIVIDKKAKDVKPEKLKLGR